MDAEAVAQLNSLPDTDFAEGDLVDYVAIFGDAPNSVGGRIEVGLQYVLDPLAFDADGPDTHPPNPEDVLTAFFSIDERDDQDVLFYDAAGVTGPVSVPADDCTVIAGGCNPTDGHEIVLPDNFVVPPGAGGQMWGRYRQPQRRRGVRLRSSIPKCPRKLKSWPRIR